MPSLERPARGRAQAPPRRRKDTNSLASDHWDRHTDGLKDLFQAVLRLSGCREDVSDLALRWKEAWVELETALQRPHARLVLTAVLLQERQTVECGNRIRRLAQDLVQQPLGLAEIG